MLKNIRDIINNNRLYSWMAVFIILIQALALIPGAEGRESRQEKPLSPQEFKEQIEERQEAFKEIMAKDPQLAALMGLISLFMMAILITGAVFLTDYIIKKKKGHTETIPKTLDAHEVLWGPLDVLKVIILFLFLTQLFSLFAGVLDTISSQKGLDRRAGPPATALEGRAGPPATALDRRAGPPATVFEGRAGPPATALDRRAGPPATVFEGRAGPPATALDRRAGMIASTGFMDILLLLLVLKFVIEKYKQSIKALGISLKNISQNIGTALYSYIGFLPILALLFSAVLFFAKLFSYTPPPEPIYELIFDEKRTVFIVIISALISIAGPFIEEVFFRGFLYSALRKNLGATRSIFLSALLFSLLHTNLLGFIPILSLGIFLAYIKEKTGSLIPSIIVHVVHNTALASMMFFMRYITEKVM